MSIEQTEEKINPVVEHSLLGDESHQENANFLTKIGPFYSLLLILVVASIFFALGRLSVFEERKGSVKVYNEGLSQDLSRSQSTSNTASVINAVENRGVAGGEARLPTTEPARNASQRDAGGLSNGGQVIGSKTGKKYYFPWCGTAKRIKPENQVKFASIEEAKRAGFTAGGNCKGLE